MRSECLWPVRFVGVARGGQGGESAKKTKRGGYILLAEEKTKRRLGALNRCGRIGVRCQLNKSLMVSSLSEMYCP